MNAEIRDRRWLFGGIALQLGTGYAVAFLVYQIGTLLTTGGLGAGFVPGLAAVVAMAAIVLILIARANRRLQGEYSLSAGAN